MAPIKKDERDNALNYIDECIKSLQSLREDWKWRLEGWLRELKPHIVQRAIAKAYCMDGDLIPYGFDGGEPKPAAFVEAKTGRDGRFPSMGKNQKLMLIYMARMLKIPTYMKLLNEITLVSKIINVETNEVIGEFTDDELVAWYQDLSKFIYWDKVWKRL